jgi:hypothetical protein
VQWQPTGGGARQTLGLGAIDERGAEEIRGYVCRLVSAKAQGHEVSDVVTAWLARVSDRFYARLAAKGLVSERRPMPRDHFPVSPALDVPPCLHGHRAELAEFPLSYLATPVVYFLLSGGELVYIGQTMQIGKRLENHKLAGKAFDRVLVMRVNVEDLETVERRMIRQFRPRLNRRVPGCAEEMGVA